MISGSIYPVQCKCSSLENERDGEETGGVQFHGHGGEGDFIIRKPFGDIHSIDDEVVAVFVVMSVLL